MSSIIAIDETDTSLMIIILTCISIQGGKTAFEVATTKHVQELLRDALAASISAQKIAAADATYRQKTAADALAASAASAAAAAANQQKADSAAADRRRASADAAAFKVEY